MEPWQNNLGSVASLLLLLGQTCQAQGVPGSDSLLNWAGCGPAGTMPGGRDYPKPGILSGIGKGHNWGLES